MLSSLRKSSRHWMFWPTIALLSMSLGYLTLLGENGYLNYLKAAREKEKLEEKITAYELQIKELQARLNILSDKDKALEAFAREFLLFPEKVAILKFQENQTEPTIKKEESVDYSLLQRIYVILASIAILSLTYLFYRREKNRFLIDDEEQT